jgi:hypothetical protein
MSSRNIFVNKTVNNKDQYSCDHSILNQIKHDYEGYRISCIELFMKKTRILDFQSQKVWESFQAKLNSISLLVVNKNIRIMEGLEESGEQSTVVFAKIITTESVNGEGGRYSSPPPQTHTLASRFRNN